MNKDIKIENATVHVCSVQENDSNEKDDIEFYTEGSYYIKNGAKYIHYTEQGEGMGKINTTLKIEDESRVTVMRSGPEQYRLVLKKGERQHSLYRTEFGELLLGVSGTKIKSQLDERGGTLRLEYILDINNAVISRNTLEINVRDTVGS